MSAQFICDHFAEVLRLEYTLEPLYYQESTRRAIELIRRTPNLYIDYVHRRALHYCATYYAGFQVMNRHSDDCDFINVTITTVGAPSAIYLISYYIAYIQETDTYLGLKHFIIDILFKDTRNKWDVIEELTMCLRFKDIVAIQRRILKCTQYGGVGRPKAFIPTTPNIPVRRFFNTNSDVSDRILRTEAPRHDEAPASELPSFLEPKKDTAFRGNVLGRQAA